MYRFAIIATVLAASTGSLAQLNRGRGGTPRERITEVCDSIYGERRDRDTRIRNNPLLDPLDELEERVARELELERALAILVGAGNAARLRSRDREADVLYADEKRRGRLDLPSRLAARRGLFRPRLMRRPFQSSRPHIHLHGRGPLVGHLENVISKVEQPADQDYARRRSSSGGPAVDASANPDDKSKQVAEEARQEVSEAVPTEAVTAPDARPSKTSTKRRKPRRKSGKKKRRRQKGASSKSSTKRRTHRRKPNRPRVNQVEKLPEATLVEESKSSTPDETAVGASNNVVEQAQSDASTARPLVEAKDGPSETETTSPSNNVKVEADTSGSAVANAENTVAETEQTKTQTAAETATTIGPLPLGARANRPGKTGPSKKHRTSKKKLKGKRDEDISDDEEDEDVEDVDKDDENDDDDEDKEDDDEEENESDEDTLDERASDKDTETPKRSRQNANNARPGMKHQRLPARHRNRNVNKNVNVNNVQLQAPRPREVDGDNGNYRRSAVRPSVRHQNRNKNENVNANMNSVRFAPPRTANRRDDEALRARPLRRALTRLAEDDEDLEEDVNSNLNVNNNVVGLNEDRNGWPKRVHGTRDVPKRAARRPAARG